MTERFTCCIDEIGTYWYIKENGEIIAETFDKGDAKDITKRLNDLFDETEQLKKEHSNDIQLFWNTLDYHIHKFEQILSKQEGMILGNVPKERLTALEDVKNDLINRFISPLVEELKKEGYPRNCRCNYVPYKIKGDKDD